MMTAEPFFMITKILSLLTEVLLGLFMLSKSLGPCRFRWRCFFLPLLFLFHTGLILWGGVRTRSKFCKLLLLLPSFACYHVQLIQFPIL